MERMLESTSQDSDFDYANYDPCGMNDPLQEFSLRKDVEPIPELPYKQIGFGERLAKFWDDTYNLVDSTDEYDPRVVGPNAPTTKFEIEEDLADDLDDALHQMIERNWSLCDKWTKPDPKLPSLLEDFKERKEQYYANYYAQNPLYNYPELPEAFYAEELRRTRSEEEAHAAQAAFESMAQVESPIVLPDPLTMNDTGYQSLADSPAVNPALLFKGKGKSRVRPSDLNRLYPYFDGPSSEFSENKEGKIKIITDREFSYGGLGDCTITGTLYAETADVSSAFKSLVGVIDRKQHQVNSSYKEQETLQLDLDNMKTHLANFIKDNDFDQDAFQAEEKELKEKLAKAQKALDELADEDADPSSVTGFKTNYGTPEKLIADLESLMTEQANDIPALQEEYKKYVEAKELIESQTETLNSDLESKVSMNKQSDRLFAKFRKQKDALVAKCNQIQETSARAYEAYTQLYLTVEDLIKDNTVLVEINGKLKKGVKFASEGELVQRRLFDPTPITPDPELTREEYLNNNMGQYLKIKQDGIEKSRAVKEAKEQAAKSPMVKGPRPQVSKTKSDLVRRLELLRQNAMRKK